MALSIFDFEETFRVFYERVTAMKAAIKAADIEKINEGTYDLGLVLWVDFSEPDKTRRRESLEVRFDLAELAKPMHGGQNYEGYEVGSWQARKNEEQLKSGFPG